jgi:lysozyme family protein
MSAVAVVVARLLSPRREGTAFVDDPDDHGGPTHFGITADFLSEVTAKACTAEDVKNLTQADAEGIYATWMMKRQFAALPTIPLMDAVTDYAVHSGPGRAIEALQRAAGVKADGGLGPLTLAAVAKDDPLALACAVCSARASQWARDFEGDPSQRTFAAGWLARLADVLEGMAG